jgi:EmrB/QacA subfamily drug resistance transporter
MLLGPIIGPTLGGLLIDVLSWRWIFFVNLPLGIVGLAAAWRLLPRGRAEGRAAQAGHALPPLDGIGLLLLPPGIASIVFGLSEFGERSTLATSVVWVPLLLGVAAVVAFVLRAVRVSHPLVEVRLFRSVGFSSASASLFLLSTSFFASMLLLPLYFQIVRGYSPMQAGLLMVPQAVAAAFGMNLGGRATDRFGAGRIVPLGLLMMAAGTVPFATVGADTPYVLLMVGMIPRGLGMGFAMMPAQAGAYATLDSRADVPRATPLLNVTQRVGGALGVAVLTVILDSQIASRLRGVPGADAGLDGPISSAARGQVAEPMAAAFAHVYRWSLAGALIAVLPALLLLREDRRARRRAEAAAGVEAAAPRDETAIVAA